MEDANQEQSNVRSTSASSEASKTSNATPTMKNTSEGLAGILDAIFNAVKVKKEEKPMFTEALKLGAISYVAIRIIDAIAGYIAGFLLFSVFRAMIGVYAYGYGLSSSFYGYNISFLPFVWNLVIGAITGAIGIFVFLYIVQYYWPFKTWKTLFARLFYTQLIISVVFGVLLGGVLVAFVPVILVSYLIVVVGSIISSYVGAKIVADGLEKKYPNEVKALLAKTTWRG